MIWDQIEDLEVPGTQLETLFSKVAVKVQAKEKVEVKAETKVNLAKIIDGKKSQNLGIFLKSKKLNDDIVKEVLMECNSSLDLETLVALKEFQASPEELALFKDHMESNSGAALDLPDQFLWDLSQIHEVDARVSCLIFQSNFQGRCEEIAARVDNLKSCCQFLQSNPNLRNVLAAILGKKNLQGKPKIYFFFNSLACGNYLNGGNRQRGQADGFGIDILPKIKDVKTNDNFGNLLSFIVR